MSACDLPVCVYIYLYITIYLINAYACEFLYICVCRGIFCHSVSELIVTNIYIYIYISWQPQSRVTRSLSFFRALG